MVFWDILSSGIATESFSKQGFNVSALVSESETYGIALQVFAQAFPSKKGDRQDTRRYTTRPVIGDKSAENKESK